MPTRATSASGLYGALAHPMEAAGIGSCDNVKNLVIQSLSAPGGKRLTGTVCLGPLKDRSRRPRGLPVLAPRPDRRHRRGLPGGVPGRADCRPSENDTGLVVKTTSVDAWRADGTQLTQASLGDPAAFNGSGYMLLGLKADTIAAKYRDDSAARGGPMMLLDLADPAAARAERGLLGVRVVGADPARGVAGRRARQRVAVHPGRHQRGAAVRDRGDRRHPRRGVDRQVSDTGPGPTEWSVPAAGVSQGVGPWQGRSARRSAV